MSDATRQHPWRVVIVGGGVAGLEALMALRDLAEHRVELTLVSAEPDFVYWPLLVGEPFGAGHARHRPLAPIARHFAAQLVQQSVIRVEPDRHAITLSGGEQLGYDALVVCVGAQPRPAYRHALTFDATGGPQALNAILADLESGYARQVTFIVPTGATWPLPIYELALMTKRHAASRGRDDVRCTVVTPEVAPLAIFGAVASDAVAALLAQRGVDVIPGSRAQEQGREGFVLTPGDRRLPPGPVVALPVPHGPRIRGLPCDDGGFIPTDEHSRVRGLDDVYAAGDGTNFPVKQGGIAAQQADAAAEHIAARAGAPLQAEPFAPVLRGKLLTGDAPLYVRHDLHDDTAGSSARDDYHLWWPPHKISGRYLAGWLEYQTHSEPKPPRRALDVEVALPRDWHADPMALDPYGPMGVSPARHPRPMSPDRPAGRFTP